MWRKGNMTANRILKILNFRKTNLELPREQCTITTEWIKEEFKKEESYEKLSENMRKFVKTYGRLNQITVLNNHWYEDALWSRKLLFELPFSQQL